MWKYIGMGISRNFLLSTSIFPGRKKGQRTNREDHVLKTKRSKQEPKKSCHEDKRKKERLAKMRSFHQVVETMSSSSAKLHLYDREWIRAELLRPKARQNCYLTGRKGLHLAVLLHTLAGSDLRVHGSMIPARG